MEAASEKVKMGKSVTNGPQNGWGSQNKVKGMDYDHMTMGLKNKLDWEKVRQDIAKKRVLGR